MATELKRAVNNALAALPRPEEIRQRIAENLQERQLLRQLLRLVERRRQAATVIHPEGRRDG
jgi:hypothetical protein